MLKLYKKVGETPLECLERLRQDNPKYKKIKMTYAGRLDPLAEGELLVLVGEECQDKDKYLGLDKEYEFEVLFGFQTDTYDILGLLFFDSNNDLLDDYDVIQHQEKTERFLRDIQGKQRQTYPPFSSKTLGGKPLFELAKNGKLKKQVLPEREIEIYEAKLLKSYWITKRDLKSEVFKKILLVKGDFRQEKILQKWGKILEAEKREKFLISKFKIKCSGGTYIRRIVDSLGEKLSYPALTFSIKRTKIFI